MHAVMQTSCSSSLYLTHEVDGSMHSQSAEDAYMFAVSVEYKCSRSLVGNNPYSATYTEVPSLVFNNKHDIFKFSVISMVSIQSED